MTTTTVNPADDMDGTVYCDSAVFATARAGLGSVAAVPAATDVYMGSNTGYRCHNGLFAFDVSALVGQTVSDVAFSLYDINSRSGSFIAQARPYNFGASITTADFVAGDTFNALTVLGSIDFSGFLAVNAYLTFTNNGTAFVAALQSAIDGSGLFSIVVNSDTFAAGVAPSGGEYWGVASTDLGGLTLPKLVITHVTTPVTPAHVQAGTSHIADYAAHFRGRARTRGQWRDIETVSSAGTEIALQLTVGV